MTLAIVLSTLIGLMLGLLGGGGSILTVPMLVYVLHMDPKPAIVTSLAVVGSSSLIAMIPHALRGRVCWKSGFLFGLSGMLGAYGGGRLAALLSGDVLMALFGAVMLVTGLAMMKSREPRNAGHSEATPGAACPAGIPYGRLLFDGCLVGAVTGLVGVGGGFVIVPALSLLVRLPMPAAVGTSLLVIVMNSAAGLVGYASHVSIDPPLTGIVAISTILGAILGGLLSTRASAKLLKRMFSLLVIAVAAYVLRQSLTPPLLAVAWGLLEKHAEFVQGAATVILLWAAYRIGRRLHVTEQVNTTVSREPR